MLRDAITKQETHNILAPEIGYDEFLYNCVLADPYGWIITGALIILVAGILIMDWHDHRSNDNDDE